MRKCTLSALWGARGGKTQGRMQPTTQECRAGNQGRGQVIKGRKLHLILTARQVTHLLVVTEVWDGECKGQVIQERKPHPMLVVWVCEIGTGGRWRALQWKGGEDKISGRSRMMIWERMSHRSCLVQACYHS